MQTQGLFRVDITPYFISLIDPNDPDDPIRKQVIPLAEEMQTFTAMMEDSLAEDRHSPVPGLVHRYPDRVLMLVTTQCASYCRYCTRSRLVGAARAGGGGGGGGGVGAPGAGAAGVDGSVGWWNSMRSGLTSRASGPPA